MTKETALQLITHKLDLAEKDPLIMNKLEYDMLQVCAEVLKQDSAFDKIKAEVEQLPITDTAIKLVNAVVDKYSTDSTTIHNRILYKKIQKVVDDQDLTFTEDYDGHKFAMMDEGWIGYFDSLDAVAKFLGIS